MNHLINITKSDGTRQLFEEEKLVNSLRRVKAEPQVIDDIVDQVESEMKDGMMTSEIYARAFSLLRTRSMRTAAKYSIRRALVDLGPDGFPFEKFISKLFHAWGYEAVTNQILRGQCVEHEVDVVAWKPGSTDQGLAMVEAKFHHEIGLKSDLKVALYVHARFEDLSAVEFDYGGAKRTLSEPWLITNTKFTDKAITYGGCRNLKMIGWNYPAKGSLHELIDEHRLYPVTCLSTITREQKKLLIAKGVILCSDIEKNLSALAEAGVAATDVPKAVNEARAVMEMGS